MTTAGLTPEEENQLIRLLNKITPKAPISKGLYEALGPILPQPSVEHVILREGPQGLQVLLGERPADDPFYGGQLHSLGTMLRAGDSSIKGALNRLHASEFGGSLPIHASPRGILHMPNLARGVAVGLVHASIVNSDFEPPDGATFYELNELPDPGNKPGNLVMHHDDLITMAINMLV